MGSPVEIPNKKCPSEENLADGVCIRPVFPRELEEYECWRKSKSSVSAYKLKELNKIKSLNIGLIMKLPLHYKSVY
tara:strand:+ start:121 stop:348 length:228 start_codon:yes stop_codon:yes gene_type:complete